MLVLILIATQRIAPFNRPAVTVCGGVKEATATNSGKSLGL
jgi:hypothetical protein